MNDRLITTFSKAPLDIIDGDRGANYPSQGEFSPYGHCLFLNAGNVSASGFNFSNCAFITRGKDQALRKGKCRRNDVVLTTRGTVGNVAYYGASVPYDDIRINSGMVILRPHALLLDPLYLYLFVRSSLFHSQVAALVTGSAQPQLPIRDINRVEIPIPRLEEQRAIAATLGALDDKIDLNRRTNETLEAMAGAIFKDWFVDFGPTRAKMEGRAPYLAPKIWSLFPDLLDNEGKPQGWQWVAARELIEFNPSEGLIRGQPAPYLDMAALPTVGSWPEAPTSREFASGSKFRNGDALLARITPCLENGKTAFVQNIGEGAVGWGSTEFIVMRARPPMPEAYSYILARDPEFRDRAIQSMTGTSGRQRVQVDSLMGFELVKPDDQVAKAFGALISPSFEKIAGNAAEIATLATTRDLLLPKLMSGEIRVRDAEKIAEAAQ